MNRLRWVRFALLITLFATAAHADSEMVSAILKPTKEYVTSIEAEIPKWQTAATWYRGLSFFAALLGLAPALFRVFTPRPKNGSEEDEVKLFGRFNVLAAAGLLAACLTLVITWGFEADHRAYKRAIQEADKLCRSFRTQEILLKASPDANDPVRLVELYQKQIEPLFKSLVSVKASLTTSVGPWNTGIVYAMDGGGTVQAIGEANYDWQAQQNSQTGAMEAMLGDLTRLLGSNLTDNETDALRDYIDSYGKRTQRRLSRGNNGVRVQTDLTLNQTFLNPALIRAYIAKTARPAGLTRELQIDALRALSSQNRASADDGFAEGTAVLSGSGGSVVVRKADPKSGSFIFRFVVIPSKGLPVVRLTELEIHEDAGPGSTRWSFYVLYEGKVIMTLPEQRWDDSKKPTRIWWDNEPWLTKQLQPKNGVFPITVVGIRPKMQEKI